MDTSQATTGRPKRLPEAACGLLFVVAPLIWLPSSHAPFADIKLLTVVAAGAMFAAHGINAPRLLVRASAVWVALVALATVAGLDIWWSVMGAEDQGAGLILFAAAAVVMLGCSSVPDDLAARIPTWLMRVGLLVAVIEILGRVSPGLLGGEQIGLVFGSTLGQPVFVAPFLAVATVAAVAKRVTLLRLAVVCVTVSALVASSNRSALIGLLIALGVVALRDRDLRFGTLAVAVTVVIVATAWTVADAVNAPESPVSSVSRFAEVQQGSSASFRGPVWSADIRAVGERPFLGSGPGTTLGRYNSAATAGEIRIAGTTWTDAHNLLIESAVTTGLLGLAGLLFLGATALCFAWKGPRHRVWALAAALALVPTHLLQPVNVIILPLMFGLLGLAMGYQPRSTVRGRKLNPVLIVALVAFALVASRNVAGVFEWFGRTYDSRFALQAASTAEPGRLSSDLALIQSKAFEARQGDGAAARAARELIERSVDRHGWNPIVRFSAAGAEVLMGDVLAADAWAQKQLHLFPNDPNTLSGDAVIALQLGDIKRAERLARAALAIRPSSQRAKAVLDQLKPSLN